MDKSLVYFLFFIVAWLSYNLYLQDVENERLFKIARDERERTARQLEIINAHKLYIELLEHEINKSSPIQGRPL